jgi:hypothetical protein
MCVFTDNVISVSQLALVIKGVGRIIIIICGYCVVVTASMYVCVSTHELICVHAD